MQRPVCTEAVAPSAAVASAWRDKERQGDKESMGSMESMESMDIYEYGCVCIELDTARMYRYCRREVEK